ncbi:MAG: hypothetical protein A2664_03845 [Candidatus Taylorbacteria bacterium RIFCSPHIGHO2_01_FULL_46_22b]|uniref:Uncharacterized protein n=1 Tax=Candidatus Taylorbacteria bacterium RIFCSPHIGHO2_01_FULL_46_22b TaxID=1802301 RepID=A0A1G2M1G1_9BACT|nr:MAG: hypothetical protein A2664_03845 [Candidatus Taylorbacteria bacterium RIFCSPHIGHO2_01_FULL_46_22b]
MNENSLEIGPRIPKPRIFPSREAYEAAGLGDTRELLLKFVSKFRAVTDLLETNWDPEVLRSSSIELRELCTPLLSMHVTTDYLDQFTEPSKIGGRQFTEEARNNPKIMTEWVAHDLLASLGRAGLAKTFSQFLGTTASLNFFENVLDASDEDV